MISDFSKSEVRSLTMRAGEHFFIDNDANHVNLQHQGLIEIPAARQAAWLEIVEARRAMCDDVGAQFLFLLAPDKQSVYRHLLPSNYAFRSANFMLQHPNVVDVAPLLASIAQLIDVYPRTDSHWNQLGAIISVGVVEARYAQNLQSVVKSWKEVVTAGDLGHKLCPPEASVRIVAEHSANAILLYDNMVPNNGRVRVFAKSAKTTKNQRRLLLVGDSFSYELLEVLKESYDITVHVHSFSFDHSVLKAFRPNFVLFELTERFLFRLPDISDGCILPALWLQKISAGERTMPVREATADQIQTMPDSAKEIVAFLRDMFKDYYPYLAEVVRGDKTLNSFGDISARVDAQVATPALRNQTKAVRYILAGLASRIEIQGISLTLYAAANQPQESAKILENLPPQYHRDRFSDLPLSLQILYLQALYNARFYSVLVDLLKGIWRNSSWPQEIAAFILTTLLRPSHRRYRRIMARAADHLLACKILQSGEYQPLCRYLIENGHKSLALLHLELYASLNDFDPWPVVKLAQLLIEDGDLAAAKLRLMISNRIMPNNQDIIKLLMSLSEY